MSISFHHKGDFSKTFSFLEQAKHKIGFGLLDKYGRLGVARLNELTPKRTGKTAASWYYEITYEQGSATLIFNNSNIIGGQAIAILIQEGHGTRNGGFVPGRRYIDEALDPIYKDLLDKVWKEVTSE